MTQATPTQINAILHLASKNAATGRILYTWELTFPRTILAEVNTHRAASRNTSSSRAISLRKFREAVRRDPFIPRHYGCEQRGMQAGKELTGWRRSCSERTIRAFRYSALLQHWILSKLGNHKQTANRYLEPYLWVTQVLSATDVNNLLLLRDHPDAEPHFRDLAHQMRLQVDYARRVLDNADPGGVLRTPVSDVKRLQVLRPGEWHLPFVLDRERALPLNTLQTLSMARCANTSYTVPGSSRVLDQEAAERVAQKLFGSSPFHLSPTEHPAQAVGADTYVGNFHSFQQYRKLIPGESGGDR